MTSDERAPACAPITGLSHVQLLVSDVGASARWYRTVLGLVPFAEDPDIGYVALQHRERKARRRAHRRPEPTGRCRAPVRSWTIWPSPCRTVTRSLDWAEHLCELGVDHAGVVLENGHPSLQLRDPDGVAIELVAP